MEKDHPSRKVACAELSPVKDCCTGKEKEPECHYRYGWLHAGSVAVDSGTIAIVDPLVHILKDDKVKAFLDNRIFGNALNGFLSSGFGGDGRYPVYVKLSGDEERVWNVTAMAIDFNENEKLFGFLDKKRT
jgi:hypothetical protein